MSTLKTVNIQHPSSASVNAGTDTSGNFLMNSGYGSLTTAYGCRAWVDFDGTGTIAIRASGNVSSITDNGVGNYTVNFATAMPDANYAAVFMAKTGTTTGSGSASNGMVQTASSVQIMGSRDSAAALIDTPLNTVAIFR